MDLNDFKIDESMSANAIIDMLKQMMTETLNQQTIANERERT